MNSQRLSETVSRLEVPPAPLPLPFSFPVPLRSPTRLRTFYEAVAPVYARLTAPLSTRARRQGLRWIAATDGERIVEIGPGPGLAFHSLLRHNPTGWTEALEPAASMRARTRRRAARVSHRRYRIRDGTATDLPYPADHIDALFSAYVYDLLSTDRLPTALSEIRRVLRPEGRAVLITMAPASSTTGHVWSTAARWLPPLLGGSRPLTLPPALQTAGLSVVRATTISQLGFPSRITEVRPHTSN